MIKLKNLISLLLILVLRASLVLSQPVLDGPNSSPVNGSTMVDPSSTTSLSIAFNTFINNPIASISVTYDEFNGVTNEDFNDYKVEYPKGSSGKTVLLTLNSGVSLTYGATYTVDLTGVDVLDGNGTNVTNTTYTFTTTPKQPPVVSLTSSSDALLVGGNIVLTLDRTIELTDGGPISDVKSLITLKEGVDANSTIDITDFKATISENNGKDVITITPDNDLDFQTTYYVALAQVRDELTKGLSVVDDSDFTFETEPIVEPAFVLYDGDYPSGTEYVSGDYTSVDVITLVSTTGKLFAIDGSTLLDATAIQSLMSLTLANNNPIVGTFTVTNVDHTTNQITINGNTISTTVITITPNPDLLYGPESYKLSLDRVKDARTGGYNDDGGRYEFVFSTPQIHTPVIAFDVNQSTTDASPFDDIILKSTRTLALTSGTTIADDNIKDIIDINIEGKPYTDFDATITTDDSEGQIITISPNIPTTPNGNSYFTFGADLDITIKQVEDDLTAGETTDPAFNGKVTIGAAPTISILELLSPMCYNSTDKGIMTLPDIIINEGHKGNFRYIDGENEAIFLSLPTGFIFDDTDATATLSDGGDAETAGVVDLPDDNDLDPNSLRIRFKATIDGTDNASTDNQILRNEEDVIIVSGVKIKYEGEDANSNFGTPMKISVKRIEGSYTGIPLEEIGSFQFKGAPILNNIKITETSLSGVFEVDDVDFGNYTGDELQLCNQDSENDNDITGSFYFSLSRTGNATSTVNMVVQRPDGLGGVTTTNHPLINTSDDTYKAEFSASLFETGDIIYAMSTGTTKYCSVSTELETGGSKTITQLAILDSEISFEIGGNDVTYNDTQFLNEESASTEYTLAAFYNGLPYTEGTFYDTNNRVDEQKFSWDAENVTIGTSYRVGFSQTCTTKDDEGSSAGFYAVIRDNSGWEELASAAISNGVICRSLTDTLELRWVPSSALASPYTISCSNCTGDDDVITIEDGIYYITPGNVPTNIDAIKITIDYILNGQRETNIQSLDVENGSGFNVFELDTQIRLEDGETYKYCEGENISYYIPSSGDANYEVKRTSGPEESYVSLSGGSSDFSFIEDDGTPNLGSGILTSDQLYDLRVTFTNTNSCDSVLNFVLDILPAPDVPTDAIFDTNYATQSGEAIQLNYCLGEGLEETLPTIEVTSNTALTLEWFDDDDEYITTTWSFDSEISSTSVSVSDDNGGYYPSGVYSVRHINTLGCASDLVPIEIYIGNVSGRTPISFLDMMISDLDDDAELIEDSESGAYTGVQFNYCEGAADVLDNELDRGILSTIEIDQYADTNSDSDANGLAYNLIWYDDVAKSNILGTGWSFDTKLSNELDSKGNYWVEVTYDHCISEELSEVKVLVSNDFKEIERPDLLINSVESIYISNLGGSNQEIELTYCEGELGDTPSILPAIDINSITNYVTNGSTLPEGLMWFDGTDTLAINSWVFDANISNTKAGSEEYTVKVFDQNGCLSDLSKVKITITSDSIPGKTPRKLDDISKEYCVGEGESNVIPSIDISEEIDTDLTITDYTIEWYEEGDLTYLDEGEIYISSISNSEYSENSFEVKVVNEIGCSSGFSTVNVTVTDEAKKVSGLALNEINLGYCVGEIGIDSNVIPTLDITPGSTGNIDSTSLYDLRWFNASGIPIVDLIDTQWKLESGISNLQESETTYKVRLRDESGCSGPESDVIVTVSDDPNLFKGKTSLLEAIDLKYCIGDGKDGVLPIIDLSSYVEAPNTGLRWFDGKDNELPQGNTLESGILNNRISNNTYEVRLVNELGCAGPESKVTINVYDNPTADFEYGVSCDQTLWLHDLSTIEEVDTLNTLDIWNWILSDGTTLERTQPLADGEYDQIAVSPGIHEVKLVVESEAGCRDTIPYIVTVPEMISSQSGVAYREDFTSTHWMSTVDNDYVASLGSTDNELSLINSSSWANTIIDGRSVAMVAGNNEYSWIESPCIDLGDWSDPKIVTDILYNTNELEGVVLQYKIKGATPLEDSDWTILGGVDEGLNWYESISISAGPGGSITGWSGISESETGDSWMTAAYGLSPVQAAAGTKAVQFRLAYASLDLPNESREDQGVFVDYISIEEKKRTNLVEHFTNLNDLSIVDERAEVMGLAAAQDIVYIQYHTLAPSPDNLHYRYFSPNTSNDHLSKGVIPGVSLVNGHLSESTNEGGDWKEEQYSYETLLSPAFDVAVSYDTDISPGEPLRITASATRNASPYTVLDSASLDLLMLLNVAVVEKEIMVDGSGVQNNVLVKFLPHYGGNHEWGKWYAGEGNEISTEVTWDIPVDISSGDFALIAWVEQSSTTKYQNAPSMAEIYQVAMLDIDMDLSKTIQVLDTDQSISGQLKVYPIPAKDKLVVVSEAGQVLSDWEIRNLQGQLVSSGTIVGNEQLNIDLSGVNTGLYLLGVQTSQDFIMKKFIKE